MIKGLVLAGGGAKGRRWAQRTADVLGLELRTTPSSDSSLGSAMLAGVAGCLYAGYLGSLYPATFKFMKSIEILVMVVLGGMGSMLGSVLSATVLTILPEALRQFEDLRMVLYSLVLVLMMIFRPVGLLGSYDFSMSRVLESILNRLFGGKLKKEEKGGANDA